MALTNDYKSCQVFDLEPDVFREGPYIVLQTAEDPQSPSFERKLFILRKDGVWVEYVTHVVKPLEARGIICFDSLTQVVRLLESLPLEPQIERVKVSEEQLLEFSRQVEAAGGWLAFIDQEVDRIRALRRQRAQDS